MLIGSARGMAVLFCGDRKWHQSIGCKCIHLLKACKLSLLDSKIKSCQNGFGAVAVAGKKHICICFEDFPQEGKGGIRRLAVPPRYGAGVDFKQRFARCAFVNSFFCRGEIAGVCLVKQGIPLIKFCNQVKMAYNIAVCFCRLFGRQLRSSPLRGHKSLHCSVYSLH